MDTIERNSFSNVDVSRTNMEWKYCKIALSSVFTIPSYLKITKYFVFQFNSDIPGKLHAQ